MHKIQDVIAAWQVLRAATDSNGMIADPAQVAEQISHFDGWTREQAVQGLWLRSSLDSGDVSLLYAKWLVYAALCQPFVSDLELVDFVEKVIASGRWRISNVERLWPADGDAHALDYLREGFEWHRAQRAQSSLSLRSGWNASKIRDSKNVVKGWTGESYKVIQDAMRRGLPSRNGDDMKYYFEHAVYRAPRAPRPRVDALYRGMHGAMAEAFQRTGSVSDGGFMSFTTERRIAKAFSQGACLMRLAVKDIEVGTPWIWFNHAHQPRSMASWEEEVLLPPGRLTVRTTDTSFSDDQALPVTYRSSH